MVASPPRLNALPRKRRRPEDRLAIWHQTNVAVATRSNRPSAARRVRQVTGFRYL